MPILTEALEDWRDLAQDTEAARALLPFQATKERLLRLRLRLDKLRTDPPQFDATDLAAVLEDLYSAQGMRQQIVEGNDLDIIVPTLRAFLFDEGEALEEKFATYPARVRYAGHSILAELWGWTHVEQWPLYSQRALEGLRLLGWQVPRQDYPTFARAFASLRALYEHNAPVAPGLPLNLEIDHFLQWVSEHPPAPSTRPAGSRRSQPVREFGTPYLAQPVPGDAWPDRPLAPPEPEHLVRGESMIRELLALPESVVQRAVTHLLSGRHLILAGAPGTGKSHLATLLATELFGYYPLLVTATAEWSTFDVVGGLVPVASKTGALHYDVRPGVVYEALKRNWLLSAEGVVQRDAESRFMRVRTVQEEHGWAGTWLVIDELNRADVDKAFGELFTALESGYLRVPRAGAQSSMLFPLPRDFRIIATLNTRDRHYLFNLSEALKRRFAFIELEPAPNLLEERATVLRRAAAALRAQGLPTGHSTLEEALDILLPVVALIRSFHPLGTAPILSALLYIGASQHLPARPLDDLAQDAFAAEILPQLEGLRDLPLALLAHLMRGQRDMALTLLADEIAGNYRSHFPLRILDALTALAEPGRAEDAARLLRGSPGDPATRDTALALLEQLRRNAGALPAPRWARVATRLEEWLAERE
jgi:MoxR-like ATPase